MRCGVLHEEEDEDEEKGEMTLVVVSSLISHEES
jgi:hypothetical protein